MTRKELITIRASGTDLDGTNANTDATSDAIEFIGNGYWSLNVWFDSLAVTGAAPTITIQVSNNSDVDSFVDLEDAIELDAENGLHIYSQYSNFRYMRIVYTSNGVTAGTKYFDLIREEWSQ